MPKKTRTTQPKAKAIVTLTHDEASRKNIPTAELESVMSRQQQSPLRVAYERRNRDLDPQLVWRGKDEQDWSDLVVPAPPLFIQEKVHPKVLVDDLRREAEAARIAKKLAAGEASGIGPQIDLFADFNGLPNNDARTDFYQHDAHWSNRMILGDSLQVMASLAEREGLRGQVQCIYIDPPYGIKFNSNFQWSTTSRDVKESLDNMTREPEQVKAFRDTWRDGIHSYLTYLKDRLVVCRDLLSANGSVFVQIGDENVHRVRALLDEVFGPECYVTEILVKKKGSQVSEAVEAVNDFIIWYSKSLPTDGRLKFRQLYTVREDTELFEDFPYVELASGERMSIGELEARDGTAYKDNLRSFRSRYPDARLFALHPLKSGGFRVNQSRDLKLQGRTFPIKEGQCWKHTVVADQGETPGMTRLAWADKLFPLKTDVRFVRYAMAPSVKSVSNWWDGLGGASSPIYVVQTNAEIVKRCILMTSDPGDLVLDPTCGSGTTAYVAEQWGRRWITIDTSRVALALARARIMGARYQYYLKADSREGQLKEAEITGTEPSSAPVHDSLRQGFVYDRARSNTSGSIANNAEIDVIWEKFEKDLSVVRGQLSVVVGAGKSLEEWEIPREAEGKWSEEAKRLHGEFWRERIGRQKEIDASIAAKAEFEYLYDKPYSDPKKVRVAGPFTVESLSPHRVMTVGADDELIDPQKAAASDGGARDFAQMILENLRTAGVQQAHKQDKIAFTSIAPWPGYYVCAEGRYADADGKEKRAGVFIGPEFGTVARQDLVAAAREAGDANFDVLIACAFNYEAMASEFNKLGRLSVLKARMNADLHMGTELKNTGKGNLFVIFGEPDIQLLPPEAAPENADLSNFDFMRVRIRGVDVFHPQSGEVRSDGPEGIACWFIDTNYNDESFFVRQAYFLGANDPYKALKTSLKAEINEEAWQSLHSDTTRPFRKPESGRIAVKVINHLGDEVMKVFRV